MILWVENLQRAWLSSSPLGSLMQIESDVSEGCIWRLSWAHVSISWHWILAGDSAGAVDWNAYIGPLQHGDLRAVELCKLWLVSPKASIPREPGKSCMVNYHLDSEVTQSNWCHAPSTEVVTRTISLKGRGHWFSLSLWQQSWNQVIKPPHKRTKEWWPMSIVARSSSTMGYERKDRI